MPSIRYRNFPIRVDPIDPKTGRYKVKINGFVPGSDLGHDVEEVRSYSPSLFDVNIEGQPVNLLQRLKARKITEEQMYELGTILSDLLLPGSIRERFWESLSVVKFRGQGLRLRVSVQVPELAVLPWEYLYLPRVEEEHHEHNFLALQREVSIVRHEAIGAAEPLLEQRKEYRLVFAAASPARDGQDQLEVEKEWDAISQMIARQQIGSVKPVWIKAATRELLLENLVQADIFHFAGHGHFDNRKGQIVLDTGEDESDYFDAKPLAKLLENACVKLAVLNACDTAARSDANLWGGVASALVKAGTAAVVASQYSLQDCNAVPLAEALYRSVLSGETIDEAVYQARLAIYVQSGWENRDWGAPVLYLRVDDGVIFRRVEERVTGDLALGVPPPKRQTELIGRQKDLDRALSALRNHSKCYIYGSHGVGKTSLANETFTRAVKEIQFADGHLWGGVANMDAEKVLEWVAAQFPGKTVARAIGQEAKINALRELLAPRDFLLGLDEVNDPEVVSAVLDAAGTNRVVLNSRPRFNTNELATEIALTPLDAADAEELFARLANKPLNSLTPEQYQIVKSICGKMKYLPMAIKLAALKCSEGGESIETLWDRLQLAPETLIDDYTFFETIHDNLRKSPTAIRLLVKIASFPTLEAPLAALRSVLQNEEFFESKDKLIAFGVVEPAGADRLSLHPVLGIGVRKSDAEDLKVEVQNTIQWLREFALERQNDYPSLDRERANLLGCCDRLQKENRWNELIAVIRSLFHYLRVRGHWQEALQRLNSILTSEAKLESDDLGWAHLHRGVIFVLRSETDKAKHDFAKADVSFTECGDTTSSGRVLYHLSSLSAMEGDLSSALDQVEEALRLMGNEKHLHDRAGAHQRKAGILVTQGKLEEARTEYERARDVNPDDREVEARVSLALGDLERVAGHYDTAGRHFARAAELVKQLGHVLDQASLEQGLGYFNYYRAEYEEALGHFQAAQDLYQQLQYQPGKAQVRHALGNIALAANKLDEARAWYAQALELNEKLHLKGNAAYNKYQLGVIAHKKQDWREAREQYEAVLAIAERIEDVALQAAVHLQLSSPDLEGDQDVAHSHATEALRLGQQVEDELTTATALYYLGWQSAVQGKADDALRNLTAAHERLFAPQSADAMKVKEAINQRKPGGTNPRILPGGTIHRILPGKPHFYIRRY